MWHPAAACIMANRAPQWPHRELFERFQGPGDNECHAEVFVGHGAKALFACRGFSSDGAVAESATQGRSLCAFWGACGFYLSKWLIWIARSARRGWGGDQDGSGAPNPGRSDKKPVRGVWNCPCALVLVSEVTKKQFRWRQP
jgi:hypothetical protein